MGLRFATVNFDQSCLPMKGRHSQARSQNPGRSRTRGTRTMKRSRTPGKLQATGRSRIQTRFQNQFWVKRPRSRFGTNPHETRWKVVRNGPPICHFEFDQLCLPLGSIRGQTRSKNAKALQNSEEVPGPGLDE